MHKTKVHIRLAQAADLEHIWNLWKDIMDQKVYYSYDDTYTRDDIEKIWINLKHLCYVAEDARRIVGAYIIKDNQPGHGKHIANASYMVDTKIRNKGIGQQLCAHSLISAKEAGYRAMQFNLVVSTNTNAIKVWKAHGFKIIGTIPEGFYHFEQGYVDAHIFYKKL